MGLLDLTTNLKSLRFGKDTPGGGNSNQPFIQTPIPSNDDPRIPNSTDFLLRDGALVRGARDVERFSKFLISSNGVLYFAKQTALSLQNPIVPGSPNRTSAAKGLYNPLLTITQLLGNSIGGHVERQGASPVYDSQDKYFAVVKNNYNQLDTNRLVILYNSKFEKDGAINTGAAEAQGVNLNSPDSVISYAGGPNGFTTNIKISNPTIKENNLPNGEKLSTYQVGLGPFYNREGWQLGSTGTNVAGASSIYFNTTTVNNTPPPSNFEILTGINEDGQQLSLYGPQDNNSTLSIDSKGLDLKNYQKGLDKFYANDFGGWNLGADGIRPVELSIRYALDGANGKTPLNLSNLDQLTGINSAGQQNKYYGPEDNNSTLSTDTKGLNLKNYQTSKPSVDFNLIDTLGASVKEGLNTEQDSGINSENQQIKLYGPEDNNSTLSKDSKSLDLSTYQVGLGPFYNNEGWQLGSEGEDVTGVSKTYSGLEEINGIPNSVDDLESLTGINREGQQLSPYGPEDDNSTLSTNRKGLILTNHLVGLKNSPTDRTVTPPKYLDKKPISSYRRYSYNGTRVTSDPDPVTNSSIKTERDTNLEGQQIVKFFFEIINNDQKPSLSEFVYLRAYLNSISDKYSAEWSDVKYTGRAEKFYQYKGFNRDMSLAFDVVAHSKAELPSIYSKIDKLLTTTTPDYSEIGYMRGTLVKVTVGDYWKSIPVIVKNIDIAKHFDTGWNLDVGSQVPKLLEVSMTLSPIFDVLPSKSNAFYPWANSKANV